MLSVCVRELTCMHRYQFHADVTTCRDRKVALKRVRWINFEAPLPETVTLIKSPTTVHSAELKTHKIKFYDKFPTNNKLFKLVVNVRRVQQ